MKLLRSLPERQPAVDPVLRRWAVRQREQDLYKRLDAVVKGLARVVVALERPHQIGRGAAVLERPYHE